MDIEDIKKAKAQCEEKIAEAVDDFNKETGLVFEGDIRVRRVRDIAEPPGATHRWYRTDASFDVKV